MVSHDIEGKKGRWDLGDRTIDPCGNGPVFARW